MKTCSAVILTLTLLFAATTVHAQTTDGADITMSLNGTYYIHESTGGPVDLVMADFLEPGTPAYLVVGLSTIYEPFGSYIMIPSPDFILGFVVGFPAPGLTEFVFTAPTGIPAGTIIHLQAWQHVEPDGYPEEWQGSNSVAVAVLP